MNIAVILAGGSGLRLGDNIPKQFIEVGGRALIEYTVEVFERCDVVDEICIISKAEYISQVEDMVKRCGFMKVAKVLSGGEQRCDSTLAAINAYKDDSCNLIFHDAVRPLVSDRIIRDCVKGLEKFQAVGVVVPTVDTIIKVDSEDCVQGIFERAVLRNAQTPQCFRRSVIALAYKIALKDPKFIATDDCGVVSKYTPSVPIKTVRGETSNIKLTYPEDLHLLEKLLQCF